MTTADDAHEFTEQELQFIFGACLGLPIRHIAERYEMAEDAVQGILYQTIFEKAGVSTRMELYLFARGALNAELRRRRLPGDSGAAMGVEQ